MHITIVEPFTEDLDLRKGLAIYLKEKSVQIQMDDARHECFVNLNKKEVAKLVSVLKKHLKEMG